MKRILLTILSILILLTVVACGKTESKCKYDNIPELNLQLTYSTSRPIKGGSLASILPYAYYGTDVKADEQGNDSFFVLFDEESKFMTPVCYDYTCDHNEKNCFSYALTSTMDGYWNVFEDTIVVVNDGFSEDIVGSLAPDHLYAFYFSFDGKLLDQISFDLRTLVKKDGTLVEYPSKGFNCTSFKNNIYFDIRDSADYSDESKLKNHWVVGYDLEKKEFYSVANYTLPDGLMEDITFAECDEKEIGIEYDKRYAYVINIKNGTYKETDCAEIFSRLITNGIAEPDSKISYIYPISRIITDISFPKCYYDIDTEDIVDQNKAEALRQKVGWSYYYDGELIYGEKSPEGDDYYGYRRAQSEEILSVSMYFENKTYRIYSNILESEKGFVLQYIDGTKTFDEALAGEQYTVIENGKEILYQKAPRLIYVTKDDYFDGQIDEPWYYDPETGMFVQ